MKGVRAKGNGQYEARIKVRFARLRVSQIRHTQRLPRPCLSAHHGRNVVWQLLRLHTAQTHSYLLFMEYSRKVTPLLYPIPHTHHEVRPYSRRNRLTLFLYNSQLRGDPNRRCLGRFKTVLAAMRAYDDAARQAGYCVNECGKVGDLLDRYVLRVSQIIIDSAFANTSFYFLHLHLHLLTLPFTHRKRYVRENRGSHAENREGGQIGYEIRGVGTDVPGKRAVRGCERPRRGRGRIRGNGETRRVVFQTRTPAKRRAANGNPVFGNPTRRRRRHG